MTPTERNFDKVAATWDHEPRRVKLASDVFRAILDSVRLDQTMDALDFGCGTGLVTLQLQPLVRSVTGVDASEGMLDVLKAKISSQGLTNVRTRWLDLEHGAVVTGSYDVIVSSMTFHHIRHIGSMLQRFYEVLRPAGQVCVADLAPDGGQFHSDNEGVFHQGFSEAQMRLAFADAGFVDIQYRPAASMLKPIPGGGEREFTVFLMTGRK